MMLHGSHRFALGESVFGLSWWGSVCSYFSCSMKSEARTAVDHISVSSYHVLPSFFFYHFYIFILCVFIYKYLSLNFCFLKNHIITCLNIPFILVDIWVRVLKFHFYTSLCLYFHLSKNPPIAHLKMAFFLPKERTLKETISLFFFYC